MNAKEWTEEEKADYQAEMQRLMEIRKGVKERKKGCLLALFKNLEDEEA